MSAILDSILPLASTLGGGGLGVLTAKSSQFMEIQAREKADERAQTLEMMRMAHGKEREQSEINIQPTYKNKFLGIRYNKIKIGLEYSSKAEALLMSPVNICKFAIAGLFSYAYCDIWLYNAVHNQQIVRTVLPDSDGWGIKLLGLEFTSAEQIIAELNLGGLSATTMAQPAIAIISYVVCNLTYKQLSRT